MTWNEKCVLTAAALGANTDTTVADSATLKITDAKLYVLIVTLSTEDTAKLSKLLSEGFKRPVYWIKYRVIDNKSVNSKHIRELLDTSYQGVKRLFVIASNNASGNDQVSADSFNKYFFPRVEIESYNTKLMEEISVINQLMS